MEARSQSGLALVVSAKIYPMRRLYLSSANGAVMTHVTTFREANKVLPDTHSIQIAPYR